MLCSLIWQTLSSVVNLEKFATVHGPFFLVSKNFLKENESNRKVAESMEIYYFKLDWEPAVEQTQ